MKIKRLLKFYYFADSLNSALDGAVYRLAVACGRDLYNGCEYYAEKMAELVEVKGKFGGLWARLDCVLGAMTEADNRALKRYAAMREGGTEEERKQIHRAVVKFSRRASNLLSKVDSEYRLVCAYYSLIYPAPK